MEDLFSTKEGKLYVALYVAAVIALAWAFATAVEYMLIGAAEEREVRIESKQEFLMSDRYEEFDVIDTTWEKRGDSYDVYLLDTVDSDVVQIAVYDTIVNDRFRAELYSGLE